MTRLLDILEDHLAWRGIECVRLDGGTASSERGGLVGLSPPCVSRRLLGVWRSSHVLPIVTRPADNQIDCTYVYLTLHFAKVKPLQKGGVGVGSGPMSHIDPSCVS